MNFKVLTFVVLVAVACAIAAPGDGKEYDKTETVDYVKGHKDGLVAGLLGNVGGLLDHTLDGVGGLLTDLLGNGGHKHDDHAVVNGKVDLGLNLQGLLGELGLGVTNIAGSAGSILKDLGKLKIPGTVDDVLNLVTGVGATVGGVLNGLLPGVGTSVGNLILGLTKIFICVLGSPGLTGDLLGDRRPGYNNPDYIPAVCNGDYGKKWGLKPYDGKYDDTTCVYDYYDLGSVDQQIRDILKKTTKGKGLDGLQGSHKYVTKWILDLSDFAKTHRKKWSRKDTETVVIILTKVIGGVGNGYKKDLGKRIAKEMIQYLRTTTKNNSYFKNIDWDKNESLIIKDISQCNKASFNGAIRQQTEETYSNIQNDIETTHSYQESQSYQESSQQSYEETRQNLQQGVSQGQQYTQGQQDQGNDGDQTDDGGCDD